jgi:ABC-2 type transport system ATP-binding protein
MNRFHIWTHVLSPGSNLKLTTLNNEGVTILISSHDFRHVTEVCNRVLLLENGIIISDTNTSEETLAKLEEYFNI